jgi:N,N'-diacetyllegionaminate synthase
MRNGKSTFVIAEAGVNHNGSLVLAKQLIDAAKAAGADAIKFQTFKTERLASRHAGKAEYQKRTTRHDESQFEMLKKLELDEKAHLELLDYSRRKKIEFLSSPFDEQSADLLDEIGIRIFKIPSGEITNLPYLAHIAKKGKAMILSTGMSTLGEVEEALKVIRSAGNVRVQLLHCVTEYPAPVACINLKAMLTLASAFDLSVGYSDHTPGTEIAIAAVALGAEIIEKHLTLSKEMEGPDHRASLAPQEFKSMVDAIRNVEHSLGDGVKRPAPCELKNIFIARKSVVAAREIKRGEKLNASNLTLKRPGHGIQPRDLDKVFGRRARTRVKLDQVITWADII